MGAALSADADVLGIVFRAPREPAFRVVRADLRDDRQLRNVIERFRPQVIVHAAAMSRVLECEADPEAAQEVNVAVTAKLVRWAERVHAKFVFLSSDQVFSGCRGGYRESDEPDPVGVYGRTKLQAETLVLAATAPALILRSNSVLGRSRGWGESFSDYVRAALQQNRPLSLFADQYRSPLHVRAMLQVIEAACSLELNGLLHIGGPQRMSRLDTGYAVARAFGLSPDLISPGSVHNHPCADVMSVDGSFDISRMRQQLPFLRLRSLDAELAEDAAAPDDHEDH